MSLAKQLNSYSTEYWDFHDYRQHNPLVKYPAIMVAPMQQCIISEAIKADKNIKNILDPFLGSGTVLIEAAKLGLDVMGFDINPLAILLSKVQLEGIPSNIAKGNIKNMFSRITMLNGNVVPFAFMNIEKWFRSDVIQSLSVIRQAICDEKNIRMRRFYWCCFAETVKKYSNTRTSTFKLHAKEQEKIDNMVNESIEFFKNHVTFQADRYIRDGKQTSEILLKCGDSKQLLDELEPGSLDIICTSPPYGDNKTTVTYGQYSILPILWIDKKDLEIWDEKLMDSFSAIDTLSLGGYKHSKSNERFKKYTKNISNAKKPKIEAFFADYECVFQKLVRALQPGKLMILTLGNRRVDDCEIRFDAFNDELAHKYGMKIDSTITRTIMGKRMPQKVSQLQNIGAVSSISTEYVKVYRREKK